jgi:DNA replication protein DnaC
MAERSRVCWGASGIYVRIQTGVHNERRSMLITANQSFGEWGKIFPDQAMTLAAVDRLVHHATILEMNVKSYRCNEALERKRGKGRPAGRATIKTTSE